MSVVKPRRRAKWRVSARMDADVVERLQADGPGWQTRMNKILRVSLGLDVEQTHKKRLLEQAREFQSSLREYLKS